MASTPAGRLSHRWVYMRTLIPVLLVLCIPGCGDSFRYLKNGEVGMALHKEIRDRKSTIVEISRLTDFEWDEMFLLNPYHPTNEVCKRLDLSEVDWKASITKESTDDGEMLLVFRLKGKVVHTEMHYRYYGDFTSAPTDPCTPRTAVFFCISCW